MKTPFHFFVVQVPRVKGVTAADWREYIEDAVKAWAGQFEPVDGGYPDSMPDSGHPLGPPCNWNNEVKVVGLRKREKKKYQVQI